MTNEEMASEIERFFLEDPGWTLEVIPEGHPICTPGRWLNNDDANYSFRPIELAMCLNKQGT